MNESLEKIVHVAGSAYSEGRYDYAKDLYQQALQDHPTNGILHANLSAIFLRMDNIDDSLKHSQTAVELCPQWAKAHYRLGESLRAARRLVPSLVSFSHGIRLDPNNYQILNSLTDTVIEYYENSFPWDILRTLKMDKDVPTILATLGQQLLKDNCFEESIQLLRWSLEMKLKSGKLQQSVLGSLAAAYYGNEDYENSLKLHLSQLELAIKNDTENIMEIRENVASSAEQCQNYQLATLQRTIRIDSGKMGREEIVIEKLKLARIYLKMRQPEDSIVILEDCRKKQKHANMEIEMMLGNAYLENNDFKKCLSILIPLSRDPLQITTNLIEGINRCFVELNDLNSSIDFLNRVICLSKDINRTLHAKSLLCHSYIIGNHLEKALKISKKILKVARSSPQYSIHESNAYRLLAMIYEHQRDVASSIVLWKKYVEIGCVGDGEIIKGLLQLGRLSQDESINENPEIYFDDAIRIAERTKMVTDIVLCLSAKYRFLLKNLQFHNARKILDRNKEFLDDKLDSKARSLIFEDIALFNETGQEQTTNQRILVLEQSLTEAQDSNDLHRELQILERLGICLIEADRAENAEKYFNQQLEVAREIRNVKMMANAHSNIARLSSLVGKLEEGSEHSRSALTLYKITKEHDKKVEMLILLASTEKKRGNLEIAMSAAEKAACLAEDCEKNDGLAKACRLIADIYQMNNGDQRMIIEFVQRHINLFEYESCSLEKLRSLMDLVCLKLTMNNYEEANINGILDLMLEIIQNFDYDIKISSLSDVCRICQTNFKLLYRVLSNLISELNDINSEYEQLILNYLRLLPYHFSALLLITVSEKFAKIYVDLGLIFSQFRNTMKEIREPFEEIITSFKNQDWNTVLNLLKCEDFSVFSQFSVFSPSVTEIVGVIELCATWHLGENCSRFDTSECRKWDLNCEKIRNRSNEIHYDMIYKSKFDMMREGMKLVDRIICAAYLKEHNLIEMWYTELIDEYIMNNDSIIDEFLRGSSAELLRFAAVFTALSSEQNIRILDILEKCEISILRKTMINVDSCVATFDQTEWINQSILYVFKVEEFTIIFHLIKDGSKEIYWMLESNKSMTFYDQVLKRFLENFGHKMIYSMEELQGMFCDILVSGNTDNWIKYKRFKDLLSNIQYRNLSEKTIDCLSFVPGFQSVYVSPYFSTNPILTLRKIEKSNILIVDSRKIEEYEKIVKYMREAPNYIITTNGKLSSRMRKMFKFGGSREIYEASNCAVLELIKNLGSNSSSNYLSTIRNDIRIALEGDYCIPNIGVCAHEDFESLVLEHGKPTLLMILNLEFTGGTHQINQFGKKLEDDELKQFFNFVYEDHIFQSNCL